MSPTTGGSEGLKAGAMVADAVCAPAATELVAASGELADEVV